MLMTMRHPVFPARIPPPGLWRGVCVLQHWATCPFCLITLYSFLYSKRTIPHLSLREFTSQVVDVVVGCVGKRVQREIGVLERKKSKKRSRRRFSVCGFLIARAVLHTTRLEQNSFLHLSSRSAFWGGSAFSILFPTPPHLSAPHQRP